MLLLGLKVGENIMIGPDITITILPNPNHPGSFRVGVDAPKTMKISRKDGKRNESEKPTQHRGFRDIEHEMLKNS